jgi:hypothetical protein
MMAMKMRTLTAIKPHKYGTRHLTAGENYEVPPRHAFALVAGRKARFADKPARAAKKSAATVEVEEKAAAQSELVAQPELPEPQSEQREEPATTLDHLRAEAQQLGIDVDGRWGAARLSYEIAQARR